MNAETLFELHDTLIRWGLLMLFFTVRPAIALLIMPMTQAAFLTRPIRFALAAMVALPWATGTFASGRFPAHDGAALLLLMAREAAIGATLGFAAGKVFWVAQSVGALLDNLSGYNNIQLTNPSNPNQYTPLSELLLQLATALFWALGGMLMFAATVYQTWQWWPLDAIMPAWPALPTGYAVSEFSALMQMVAAIALPMLFLISAIEIASGLVSRAAKGADTSPLAMPLRAAAALLSLALFASVFLQDVRGYLALEELPRLLERWRDLGRETP